VEEIDTMYLIHVNPRESTKWIAPPPEQLITTEKLVRGASATGADVERTADLVAEPGTTIDHAD
jgi:SP family sugar:H+ symporter-like MFS transporter